MKQKIESWADVKVGTILYRLPNCVSTDFTKVFSSFANQLKCSLDTQWKIIGISSSQHRVGLNATPTERSFTISNENNYCCLVFVRNKIEKALKFKNEYFVYGYDENKFAEDEYGYIYTYDIDEYTRLAKAMSFEYERFLREEMKRTKKLLSECFKRKRNS